MAVGMQRVSMCMCLCMCVCVCVDVSMCMCVHCVCVPRYCVGLLTLSIFTNLSNPQLREHPHPCLYFITSRRSEKEEEEGKETLSLSAGLSTAHRSLSYPPSLPP